MKSVRTHRGAIAVGIILVIQLSVGRGHAWGQSPLDWKPFGIDQSLLPDFSEQLQTRESRPPIHAESKREWLEGTGATQLVPEKSLADEPGLTAEARFGRLRLYLTRSAFAGVERDIEGPLRDRNRTETFDRLKTLPGDLRNNPGRAFESLGGIFQPQLNLGIEF